MFCPNAKLTLHFQQRENITEFLLHIILFYLLTLAAIDLYSANYSP